MTPVPAPAPLLRTACPDDGDRRRRPIFLILLLSLVLLSSPAPSRAAHSRRARTVPTPPTNRPPPRYDRSITTFSADGRLLQVEYGMKASDRGLTVAAFDLDFGVADGEEAVCVAVVASDVSSDDADSSEGGTTKVHRLDDHLLAATTGLSGDGRALASSVRVACRRMKLSNGEPATVREAAVVMGDAQHQLTRIGGARPFGVSGTIWGVDPFPEGEEEFSVGGGEGGGEEVGGNETTRRRKPKLYQSEPGGTVERYDVCAAGRGRVEAVKTLLALRARLKEMASAAAASTEDDSISEDASSSLLAETVRSVARAALESDGSAPGAPPPSTEDEVGGGVSISGTDGDGTEKMGRKRRADVYVVQADPKRRGGSRVRCARNVRLEDLDDLGKVFVR